MSDFLNKLSGVCHNILLDNEKILAYLMDHRKITMGTIQLYQIGSFPSDLRNLYNKHGLDAKELREKNIIYNASNSQFRRYPIVIPVRNISGETVAIGCRTLLSDDKRKLLGIPKYRNSIYKKTKYLFGLDGAFNAIRRLNKVFVVEGYFDAITAHQHGIKNVVATCGTIFSERQVLILSRYTKNICMLFDNDKPGYMSSKKIALKFGGIKDINIKCMFVPDGFKDLDEYLIKGGDMYMFNNTCDDLDNIQIKPLW